jgi:hypothetical protein
MYAEVVFIGNFFIDAFIFALTLYVLKSPVRVRRVIAASAVGGAVSAGYPFFPDYGVILKILCIVILPAIVRRNETIKNYFCTVSVFSAVTLILGGAVYLLKCCLSAKIAFYLGYGLIPILLSVSALCVLFLISYLKNKIRGERSANGNMRSVRISDGFTQYEGEAYFDSGNRIYANNGETVTVVSETVYNMFCGKEEEVAVSSVGGISVLKAKNAEITIYSAYGGNKIYKTKIAASPKINGYGVILHNEMSWR